MSTTWLDLDRELAAWREAGARPRLWWRDDDAAIDTPELRRLLAIAEGARTSVALAVIPSKADESLVRLTASAPCVVWQHGWRHEWRVGHGRERYEQGELGAGRPLEAMARDLRAGQRALDMLLGARGWQRVLVPPFHALTEEIKALLPLLGYEGLSSGAPWTSPIATVAEASCHLDIMNWPERRFWGASVILDRLTAELAARRKDPGRAKEPLGLLTHHLAHDAAAWSFVEELLLYLASEPAVELVPPSLLFDRDVALAHGSALVNLRGSEPAPSFSDITVVVTSCGRTDLLDRTLDSFLRHNSAPVREILVMEDGGAENARLLADKYRAHPFRWLATGDRVGQIAAIDRAYREVRTELIFHCEDDWEFLAPGFMERSLAVLSHHPAILQIWLRAQSDTNNHPVLDLPFDANGVAFRLLRHNHDAGEWGTWHGLSWNPGLRRRSDYERIGSFASLDPDGTKETWRIESEASAFYQKLGFFAAILGQPRDPGFVRHIGGGRRVPRVAAAELAAASRSASSSAPSELGLEHVRPQIGLRRDAEAPDVARAAGAPTHDGLRRDAEALELAERLAFAPFDAIPLRCPNDARPGIDEVPEWQIWTDRKTTADQLRIEEALELLVDSSTTILHIGAGNSSLGWRFAPRVARIVGTTLHDEERLFAHSKPMAGYSVLCANKYSRDMDGMTGPFSFIVDNNPASFACCRFHFARMMVVYGELLAPDGSILTAEPGLSWRLASAPAGWSVRVDDWRRLGKILGMPVRRLTEHVFAMDRSST